MLGIGVTATDTEIGKTVVSGALAAAMRHRGYKTGVYKPAASGCVKNSDGKLISTDAEFLLHCAGLNVENMIRSYHMYWRLPWLLLKPAVLLV